MTGLDGSFTITVPENNAALIFSYIGFARQEITVGNQTDIKVSMKEDTRMMEEVVVIGYGAQSRAMLTTSVSKVDNKVLANIPYPNTASALQGSVSGVRVQNTTGQPGDAPRIIIRGGTSINNPDGAAPLYIIDGIIAQMNDLTGYDIESIQVLKDAAATSIYGAKGSNGVVIITTKTGKAGKTRINYTYNMTMSKPGKLYDLVSAREYLTFTRLGKIYDKKYGDGTADLALPGAWGTGNDLTNRTLYSPQYLSDANKHKLNEGWQQMPDPLDPSKTIIFTDTDYQAINYRTGFSHSNHIEVSGGSDKATFNAGLGYLTNEGPVITSEYNRLSLNLNGMLQAAAGLKVYGSARYSNSQTKRPDTDISYVFHNPAPPTAKLRFEDGSYTMGPSASYGNPLNILLSVIGKSSYETLSLSLKADWTILPKLTFSPQLSMFEIHNSQRTFRRSYMNGLSKVTTRNASASHARLLQYQAEGVFNYTDTFDSDHNVGAMAGLSYYSRENSGLNAAGRGAASDKIPTLNAVAERTAVGGTESTHLMMGYFGRLNYNYKYKYLLSLNARYDGASNLGNEHKWGFFPGASIGWHLDKEDFWNFLPKDLLKIKLRASYGVNGNISGLGDFTAQGEYAAGSTYMDQPAIMMSVMANHNLQWERSKTLDLGTDWGLFDGRVNILFDWFNRVTDNLLTSFSLPASTGFTSIQTNLGSLQNRGVEMEVSADILPATSKLRWNMSFNASKVTNKILKLPDNGIENNRIGGYYIWDDAKKDYAWKGGLQEGGRIGDIFAFQMLRVFPTDEDAKNAPKDMLVTTADKTKFGGDVDWLDADGNGVIDNLDRRFMGNQFPKWTGGFSNTLSYKGLDFYIRTDYSVGHIIFNNAIAYLEGWQVATNLTRFMADNSWKKQGDIAKLPRYYYAGDRGAQNITRNGSDANSFWYEKGDYLCIREVSLSYNIPAAWMNKVHLQGLRLAVTGNNLYYFTKYRGLNPEEGRKDYGRYAMPRNIIFSANVTF